MALCDVALGKCYDTCSHNVTFKRPPDDFDSVHGVKRSDDVTSDFKVKKINFCNILLLRRISYKKFKVVLKVICKGI